MHGVVLHQAEWTAGRWEMESRRREKRKRRGDSFNDRDKQSGRREGGGRGGGVQRE